MYCSNCGSQLKETDIFCSQCGHKQNKEKKSKEPPKEEVVFNAFPEKGKSISFADQEDYQKDYGRESEAVFRAPKESHQSVNNARRPVVDDFVWNVHDFPEPGPRETEDIDFRWDQEVQPRSQRFTRPETPPSEEFVDDSKFHTYNKTREEFQELLDKEYVRQNREPDYPVERGYIEQDSIDPRDHIGNIGEPLEDGPKHYKEREYHEADDFDIKKTRLFKGQEFDEAPTAQEQVFEIPSINLDQDLDTKQTTPSKTTFAPSIPPVGGRDYQEPSPIEDVIEHLPFVDQGDRETMESRDLMASSEGTEEIDVEKIPAPIPVDAETSVPTPGIDERLSKLWDSDTAPIPVSSLGGKSTILEKETPDDSQESIEMENNQEKEDNEAEKEDIKPFDPLDDIYEEEDGKDGRRGGFFGKFIIAIIIIILIIEGSILGLRNFAPESEATAKANQVILTMQNWVENTFFDKE